MHTTKLSKWWKTPSAKTAWQRAEEKKQERLAKLREEAAAKKAAQEREVRQWRVKK